jgi:hypothetical protein
MSDGIHKTTAIKNYHRKCLRTVLELIASGGVSASDAVQGLAEVLDKSEQDDDVGLDARIVIAQWCGWVEGHKSRAVGE